MSLFNAPGVWVHLPGSRILGTWATGSKIFVTKIKNVIQLMKLHQRTSDIHSENNSNNQNSNSKKVWWTKNLTYGRTNPNLITILTSKLNYHWFFSIFSVFPEIFSANLAFTNDSPQRYKQKFSSYLVQLLRLSKPISHSPVGRANWIWPPGKFWHILVF